MLLLFFRVVGLLVLWSACSLAPHVGAQEVVQEEVEVEVRGVSLDVELASRLLLDLGTGQQIYQCDRGKFLLSDNDLHISRSLKAFGSYDDDCLSTVLNLIRPGDVVLDIGANIGSFTVPMAAKVATPTGNEGGMVFAFEALQMNFHSLVANLALNGLSMYVHAHVGALDDVNGKVFNIPRMDSRAAANFGSISLPKASLAVDSIEASLPDNVRVVSDRLVTRTIDSFDFPKCPTLIKIDVETMEVPVLKGGAKMLELCRPIIHAENNCVKTSPPLLELFTAMNYTCYWDVHLLRNPNSASSVLTSINNLCLPSERVYDAANAPDDTDGKVNLLNYVKVLPGMPLLSQYPGMGQQEGSMESCHLSTFTTAQ
jgi:FkbM family methyltransferase